MWWQLAVCSLIEAFPAAAAVAVIWMRGRQPQKSVNLWFSSWRYVSPFWLLGYRGVVFLGMSGLLIQIVLIEDAAFYFYTQWTFTLVTIYFMIGTLISAHGCWIYTRTSTPNNEEKALLFHKIVLSDNNIPTSTDASDRDGDEIKLPSLLEGHLYEARAGLLGYAMQIIYQTCAGAVILTDVVFWGLLLPFMSGKHFRLNLIIVCEHSVNAVFLLIDTFLNSLPFPWFGMAYFVLWSCAYVIFQWVLHACGHKWWPYAFMELSTPWAPLWYLALALVHIPCFGLYYLIANGKNSFFFRLFPNSYIKS